MRRVSASSPTLATGPPATAVLSPSNYNGAANYYVVYNIWWGNSATSWTLFENGAQVFTGTAVDVSPNPQTNRAAISNKPNGVYVYTAIMTNSFGSTNATPYTVTVTQGKAPAAPPAIPTSFVATVNSSTQITLTWNPSSTATRYDIQADGVTIVGVTSPYTSSGLAPSSSHTYAVRAANSAGDSNWSANVTATTQPALTPPAVPSGLTATPASSSQINLAWSAVSGASSYNLLIDGIVTSGVQPPYAVIGLQPSSTHTFAVQSSNSAGSSVWSATVIATTLPSVPIPPVPTGLIAVVNSYSSVTLTWTAVSGATGYDAQVNGATVVGVTQPYIASGLAGGSTNTFAVRATNSAGASAWCPNVTATTPSAPSIPAVPTGVMATASSSSSITVTFSSSVGATSYDLMADNVVISGVVSPYVASGLAGSSTHTYAVRADNSAGNSAWSANATATTLASNLPAAPMMTATANSAYQVTIVYWGVAGATSYDLLKNGSTIIPGIHTPYLDQAVQASTTYTYAVRANNANGAGPWCTAQSVTTPASGGPVPPLTSGSLANPNGRLYSVYFGSWAENYYTVTNSDGSPQTPNQIYAASLMASVQGVVTCVNISFAQPNFTWAGIAANTWVGTGIQFPVPPTSVLQVVKILHTLQRKVVLSVGGATYGSWTALAAEAGNPGPITAALSQIVTDLELDGLDIDFEIGSANAATVTEYTNCILTMRAALDASSGGGAKMLTIAAWSTGSDYIAGMSGQPGYPGVNSYWGGSAGLGRMLLPQVIPNGAYAGKTVASLFNLANTMLYDASVVNFDPAVAWQQYRALFPASVPVLFGFEVPAESWGGGILVATNAQAGVAGTIVTQDQYGRAVNQPYSVQRDLSVVMASNVNPQDGCFTWEQTLTTATVSPGAGSTAIAAEVATIYNYVPVSP